MDTLVFPMLQDVRRNMGVPGWVIGSMETISKGRGALGAFSCCKILFYMLAVCAVSEFFENEWF